MKFRVRLLLMLYETLYETLTAAQEHPAGATFQGQTWPAAAQWAGWRDLAAKLKFQQAQAVVGAFSKHETLTAAQEHPCWCNLSSPNMASSSPMG